MKVGENHPRIRLIKNYIGKYCDNYAEYLEAKIIGGIGNSSGYLK